MFRKIHAPFRKVRKKLKLSRLHYFLEELEGDYNLICDLPSFFPQKKLPENYEYIGPLFYRDNKKETEIHDFLAKGNPRILVSVGSTGSWKNLNALLDPIFNDTKIIVSGNIGNTIHSDNIITTEFLNHTDIMNSVDIVISHGGNGTAYQALAYKVPLLFFSGNFEQEWNIQRIIELGLGERLEDYFDAAKIRETINACMKKKVASQLFTVQQEIQSYIDKPVLLNIKQLNYPTQFQ